MTWYSRLSCLLVVGVGVACAPRTGTSPLDADRPEWTVLIIAHRGGPVPGAPENTLAAFRRAIALKVDAIEIDLRATRDGEIVIIHDRTLDRTTDGTGRVGDHTLEEVKRLNAGEGESVPTLAEVLDLVAGTGTTLLLDIKSGSDLDKRRLVRGIEKRGAVLKVVLGVKTLEDLKEFRALDPNLRTLGLVRSPAEIDGFLAAGIDIVRLKPDWIREDGQLVKMIQGRGRPVWATAGDAPRDVLEELVRSGVNGILTARPEELAGLSKEMEANRSQR